MNKVVRICIEIGIIKELYNQKIIGEKEMNFAIIEIKKMENMNIL